MTILEKNLLTMRITAFSSFYAMIHAQFGYRPSLRSCYGNDYVLLADCYDEEQSRRGDTRRAYRG